MRRRPRWSLAVWLLVSHMVVGVAAVVALLLTGVLTEDLRVQTSEALEGQAQTWAVILAAEAEDTEASLAEVARRAEPQFAAMRDRVLIGLQVVDADANIVASSVTPSDRSLGKAPEVRVALAGAIGRHARPRDPAWLGRSAALDGPSRFGDVRLFVAAPVVVEEEIVGAVVVSRTPRAPVQAMVQVGSPLLWRVLAIVVIAVVIALTGGYFGSRSFRRLVSAAQTIASGSDEPGELESVRGSRVEEVSALAAAVETMGARLRRRMDGAEAFAGNAAHEFRTPIATLRGTLELLRDDPSMASAQRERFLDTGISELHRLDNLVGGLLDLGRAQRLAKSDNVDLDALLHRFAESHGARVSGRAGFVAGSEAGLEVVIGNLLDNAAQHGGPGVQVRAERTSTQAVFEVIDDGQGIAPDVLEQLFDRFYTTDRQQGVGLGLAVVRGLVRAHAGTIDAQSQPGATRFVVRLPLPTVAPHRCGGDPHVAPHAKRT
ncbi:MAG: sensor histidine kinase [Nannocystales bacterium]